MGARRVRPPSCFLRTPAPSMTNESRSPISRPGSHTDACARSPRPRPRSPARDANPRRPRPPTPDGEIPRQIATALEDQELVQRQSADIGAFCAEQTAAGTDAYLMLFEPEGPLDADAHAIGRLTAKVDGAGHPWGVGTHLVGGDEVPERSLRQSCGSSSMPRHGALPVRSGPTASERVDGKGSRGGSSPPLPSRLRGSDPGVPTRRHYVMP